MLTYLGLKGLLTATQKLNRRRIVPMYQKDIDALYLKSKM